MNRAPDRGATSPTSPRIEHHDIPASMDHLSNPFADATPWPSSHAMNTSVYGRSALEVPGDYNMGVWGYGYVNSHSFATSPGSQVYGFQGYHPGGEFHNTIGDGGLLSFDPSFHETWNAPPPGANNFEGSGLTPQLTPINEGEGFRMESAENFMVENPMVELAPQQPMLGSEQVTPTMAASGPTRRARSSLSQLARSSSASLAGRVSSRTLRCSHHPQLSFANRATYNRHMSQTRGHPQCQSICDVCEASFSRRDALFRHQKSKHSASSSSDTRL